MDIEQLKLIMQTLSGAGEGAKEVALWYVASSVLVYILGWIGVVVVCWIITRCIMICVRESRSSSTTHQGWEQVCRIVDEHAAAHNPTEDERRHVIKKLKTLTEEKI